MDREEVLRRFEAWLDGALAAEEPPRGIAAEILTSLTSESDAAGRRCDLYSMWAAVTALTQEVRLQGRSFKHLSETLAPVAEAAPRLPEMEREAQERARREILGVLLDLRDRLARGLDAARLSQANLRESVQLSWTARLLSRNEALRQASEGMAALEEGYRMSLERLNEVLAQFDVREIDCQGELFDPSSMHVVDVEESDRTEDGTVVEVYRAGYEWKGEVYRPAQVKVARKPAASAGGDEDE